MAVQPNHPGGTRFRLYPQAPILNPAREPETVIVSSPAGSVGPGPEDDRMYAINPVDKWPPYGVQTRRDGSPYLYLPPWDGDIHLPAFPNQDGHFDYLDEESPEFLVAHLFGCVRFVQDIWDDYFGETIAWHSADAFDKMELVHLPRYDNSRIGFGFIEFGSSVSKSGSFSLDATNFDIIAHEVGHGIIYSTVGLPDPEGETGEYNGFHESAADLVAIISCLHFDSIVDELLENTEGNLYTLNRLNRIAELSHNEQIRLASNTVTMSQFIDGWRREHVLSQPLTGAIFDTLIDIFHEQLLERALISPEVENLADRFEYQPRYQALVQEMFSEAYAGEMSAFKEALLDARDIIGHYLAETWRRLPADYLSYLQVGDTLCEVDQDLSGGEYDEIIIQYFYYREIGQVPLGPQLAKLPTENHMDSSRWMSPDSWEFDAQMREAY